MRGKALRDAKSREAVAWVGRPGAPRLLHPAELLTSWLGRVASRGGHGGGTAGAAALSVQSPGLQGMRPEALGGTLQPSPPTPHLRGWEAPQHGALT